MAQRYPRLDPGFTFKEHLDDGERVVRVYIPSLTFLLIGWFSPAEEAKRPICSGFLRFRPERKGVYTNRPGNGPTEECEKSVLVEDPGASGCARSGAGLPDEAFRQIGRAHV